MPLPKTLYVLYSKQYYTDGLGYPVGAFDTVEKLTKFVKKVYPKHKRNSRDYEDSSLAYKDWMVWEDDDSRTLLKCITDDKLLINPQS